MAEQDQGLVSHIGPIEIDWPRSIGYYGGIGLAVAAGMLEPPVAVFIAVIPFLKMLNHPKASRPTRFVAQVLDGAAKPVGGDAGATIQLRVSADPLDVPRLSIWSEARVVADRFHAPSNATPAGK